MLGEGWPNFARAVHPTNHFYSTSRPLPSCLAHLSIGLNLFRLASFASETLWMDSVWRTRSDSLCSFTVLKVCSVWWQKGRGRDNTAAVLFAFSTAFPSRNDHSGSITPTAVSRGLGDVFSHRSVPSAPNSLLLREPQLRHRSMTGRRFTARLGAPMLRSITARDPEPLKLWVSTCVHASTRSHWRMSRALQTL